MRTRIVTLIALALCLVAPVNQGLAEDDESSALPSPGIKLDLLFGYDFRISYGLSYVSGVPASIRAVPAHPDDGGRAQPPIEPDNVPVDCIVSGLLPGGGIRLTNNDGGSLSLGVRPEIVIYPRPAKPSSTGPNIKLGEGNIRERNYQGNPGTTERGYGTALTYWGVGVRDWFIPQIAAEYKKGKFRTGIAYSKYVYQLEWGWDRYDKLETKDVSVIASVDSWMVYATFNMISVGYTFTNLNINPDGEKLQIEQSPNHFSVGVTIPLSF